MSKGKECDFYRVLHVDPQAPVEIIRASYRTLMQRLRQHPDLGGDHATAALINEAYAVLTDAGRRAEYDRRRTPGTPDSGREDAVHEDPVCKDAPPRRAATPSGRCGFCAAAIDGTRPPQPEDRCARCATPLLPAGRMRLDASGQRMLARMQRRVPVTCYTSWPQATGFPATMQDLSPNGMRIAAGFEARAGSLLKVDCELCQSLSRVVYCSAEDGGWIIGLEFVTLSFRKLRGSFVSTEI